MCIRDSPDTPEKIELGKMLFFDPVLSGDNTVSCAHCHHPDLGFSDNRGLSMGNNGKGVGRKRVGGVVLRRSSPTLWNVGFNHSQYWDGRAKDLEHQAMFPITDSIEMDQDRIELEKELKNKLENLHMVHYYEFGRRMFRNLPPVSEFEKENIPPVSHPLIRLHPDRNNDRSLFFTANAGNEIGGMTQEKGACLHKKLVDIVSASVFKYKHRWKKGDLVMWDNRCLLHRAIPYDMNKYIRVFFFIALKRLS